MEAGGTFFLQAGTDPSRHLWVVVSSPSAERVLAVSITSLRGGPVVHDDTCILEPRDHRFLIHRSWVKYASADLFPSDKLRRVFAFHTTQIHDPVTPELLKRIRDGFMSSPHAKNGHQQMLVDQGFTEWEQ